MHQNKSSIHKIRPMARRFIFIYAAKVLPLDHVNSNETEGGKSSKTVQVRHLHNYADVLQDTLDDLYRHLDELRAQDEKR